VEAAGTAASFREGSGDRSVGLPYGVTHYRSVLAQAITTAEKLVLELSDGRPWPCRWRAASRPAPWKGIPS